MDLSIVMLVYQRVWLVYYDHNLKHDWKKIPYSIYMIT